MKYRLFLTKGDCGKYTAICLMKKVNKGTWFEESILTINFRNFKTGQFLFSIYPKESLPCSR